MSNESTPGVVRPDGRRPHPRASVRIVTPWGLDKIRELASSPWRRIRDFSVRRILVPYGAKGGLDRESIERRPREDLFWTLVAFGEDAHRLNDLANDAELAERMAQWMAFLRDNGVAEWPNWGKGDRKIKRELARQARCVKAGQRIADCVATILGRRLEPEEWKLAPNRVCDEYDERTAQLCRKYAQGSTSLDAYFWSVVQVALQVELSRFERILGAVSENRVPRDMDINGLNADTAYLEAIGLRENRQENGAVGYCIVAESYVEEDLEDSPGSAIPAVLLAPAALEVMRSFEKYFEDRGDLFVVTCHNPVCGKKFYTRDRRAVACPKRPHERVTSPCKREWDKYNRWLKGEGRDPYAAWHDPRLKKRYLSHTARKSRN